MSKNNNSEESNTATPKKKKLVNLSEKELLLRELKKETQEQEAEDTLDDDLERQDYGRTALMRDPSLPISNDNKTRYARRIMLNIREGMSFDSACWAATIEPEMVAEWMKDPKMRISIMRQVALTERDLVRQVRKGGQGLSRAKAALEVLERLFKGWSSKSTTTLQDSLKDALDELEKTLPAETYETVLRVISRHSR